MKANDMSFQLIENEPWYFCFYLLLFRRHLHITSTIYMTHKHTRSLPLPFTIEWTGFQELENTQRLFTREVWAICFSNIIFMCFSQGKIETFETRFSYIEMNVWDWDYRTERIMLFLSMPHIQKEITIIWRELFVFLSVEEWGSHRVLPRVILSRSRQVLIEEYLNEVFTTSRPPLSYRRFSFHAFHALSFHESHAFSSSSRRRYLCLLFSRDIFRERYYTTTGFHCAFFFFFFVY